MQLNTLTADKQQ